MTAGAGERADSTAVEQTVITAVTGHHLPALNGLRALAVFGVVAYHLQLGWASGGYLGVDLFFVLSGFLITSLLLEEWVGTGRVVLGDFWARRAKRLLPALFLVLVALAVRKIDARAVLVALCRQLEDWSVEESYRAKATALAANWDLVVQRAYALRHAPLAAQSEVIGAVNEISEPTDVVVCAAGSMPGDLHKLWRTRDPKGYHVEYGYSCMGYEIAGGLGVKMAAPDREVYVMVGDGSYLMMSQELVTAVQENIKLTVVLVQNHGFASIGRLSELVGAERFGTSYRYRNPESGRLDGGRLPVDLAANAESLGVTVFRTTTIDELRGALRAAKSESGPVLIHIETDPLVDAPESESWWDVPVAEVSRLDATAHAREAYDEGKQRQRRFL